MDARGLPMYQDPRMTMMGQSDNGSVPGGIPMNYPMGNPNPEPMGMQESQMSNNHVSFNEKPHFNEISEQQHYSQLPVRKEVDEEGRICGVVLSKTAEHLPNEENDVAEPPTDSTILVDTSDLPTKENGADHPPSEENNDELKVPTENIKTEEDDELDDFNEYARDLFLKVSNKEIKIGKAVELLGKPYSFVYSRYQDFKFNAGGNFSMKKKKKGQKTKKEGNYEIRLKGKSKKSGKRYQCQDCPAIFRTEYLIKAHSKVHEEDGESHLCTACGIVFSKLGQLMRHRLTIHQDALQCPHCDKTYTVINTYKFHLNTHSKVRPFVCDECGKGFFSRVSLEDHHRLHTGEKPFMCGYCEKTFATINNLKLHQYTHTGGRPNKPKRKKQKKTLKKYECQECGRGYISSNKLEQHMNIHTGAKPFECDLCDARFSLKPNLTRHKMKHTGVKPFKCNYCPAAFLFKSELKLHDMAHTGNKPFKCSFCEYSCVRKSKLDYHMNTHTGEKPFKCDYYGCSAEYPSPSTLKQHKEKHGPPPLKTCEVCHEKFPDINSLKRHMMIHPGNEPIPCDQCDKIFFNESTLKRHMHVHMYKRPRDKPKVIRSKNKKMPEVKRTENTVAPQKRMFSEYQAPAAAENGHSSIAQSWTINAEDTSSQQSYHNPYPAPHSFPANQFSNLNAWPTTFDPDELRNRLLASFK